MLNALRMLLAKFLRQTVLIFVFKVKAGACQDRVLLHDLVQDVDVEGQALSGLKLLDELAADGTANTILVMQLLNAACAECVPTVDQDAWNSLTYVILEAAERTNIEPPRLIV